MNRSLPSCGRTIAAFLCVTAAVAAALLTGGCTLLKPAERQSHYYLLTPLRPVAAQTATNQGCVVRLRPIEVADYLRTKDMAVRTDTNEVTFALFHRWAEPLDSGIRRVLAEDLRAAPAIREVLSDQPAPLRGPVYTISVHILACEGISADHGGSTAFEAAWQIIGTAPAGAVLAHGVFRAPARSWIPGDYGQLASQTSLAVDELSKVLVNALRDAGSTPSG